MPPVLLCIDHECLESEELYEFDDGLMSVCCSAAEPEKRLGLLVQSKRFESPGHVLGFGKITLDTSIYEVRIEGTGVDLAWMEYHLLKFLMENLGRIFGRDQLLSSV